MPWDLPRAVISTYVLHRQHVMVWKADVLTVCPNMHLLTFDVTVCQRKFVLCTKLFHLWEIWWTPFHQCQDPERVPATLEGSPGKPDNWLLSYWLFDWFWQYKSSVFKCIPVDFAGHRYCSADAATQPLIVYIIKSLRCFEWATGRVSSP